MLAARTNRHVMYSKKWSRRSLCTDFFKLVPKDGQVSLLSNGTQFVIAERADAEKVRSNSGHVNFTGMRDFNRGHAVHKPYIWKACGATYRAQRINIIEHIGISSPNERVE